MEKKRTNASSIAAWSMKRCAARSNRIATWSWNESMPRFMIVPPTTRGRRFAFRAAESAARRAPEKCKAQCARRRWDDHEARTALCISGGGIRSATFALGVIQGLAGAEVLDK